MIHPSTPSNSPMRNLCFPESSSSGEPDLMGEMEAYREIVQENIEYGHLVQRYGVERINELVQFLLDAICTRRKHIRIDSADYPKDVVKSRLLKLNVSHIEYVLDCMDQNTAKIRNIKSYLLTALYNSLGTMDTYYRSAVNHDLHSGP